MSTTVLRGFCNLQFIRLYLILLFSEPNSTQAKLSKPKHKNAQLEQLIAQKNGETKLDLSWKKLTAEDMLIVAYYALQENTVSDVEFYVMTEERNGFFCPDYL
jgi:hypothetical protein